MKLPKVFRKKTIDPAEHQRLIREGLDRDAHIHEMTTGRITRKSYSTTILTKEQRAYAVEPFVAFLLIVINNEEFVIATNVHDRQAENAEVTAFNSNREIATNKDSRRFDFLLSPEEAKEVIEVDPKMITDFIVGFCKFMNPETNFVGDFVNAIRRNDDRHIKPII